MTTTLPFSQACENNKAPILEELREIFDTPGTVLEVGTGTGQHAVHFATAMPHLQWQPTDHPDAVDTCRPRLAQAALPNILPVIELDVSTAHWPVATFNWAFSANTAHIMAWREVEQMFHGIGERLAKDGAFCLYGPFNNQGRYSSDSNRRFDQHLRAHAAHMGIRDLDDLCALADTVGLNLTENHAMPANNRLLVFRRGRSTAATD
ncbi:DUF938 domain-containing protein [Marinobacter lipolyticus]|uniref:DUF938 domain-containing protein n=1 Tax=Marinobacter lipolyticus TaxID=209639 RepID=UPI001BCE148E|nr:DUF938 domain-containing protein [Marinobacter lipolyticus]MBS8240892.1 DUF938 domain-containing protein [Marinobacter lipolyticus]